MLKVLFVTASKDASGRTNVGDRVILAGARNLIAGAFGAYAYREIGRWGEFPFPADDFDLVVYAGMPQYGSRKAPTAVEQRFQAYLDSAKKAVFINIGGGTPTGIDLDVEGASGRMAQSGVAAFYQAQKGIALRTTRDLVGKRFFDKIGSPCDLRPCPSFFSTMHLEQPEKTRDAIAFLSDDTFVTNRVRGSMSDHLDGLIARLPGYELVAHSGGDLVQLGRVGRKHLYFRSELDAIDYYATVRRLASLRIHAGVPSWTMGGDVVVAAFDGRANMFADVGMPLPVIDLVKHPFEALADMVEDPKTHTPYETRHLLIRSAYAAFVGRLRQSCPDIAAKATLNAQSAPDFMTYPLSGAVERAPDFDGFVPVRQARPPRFVPEGDGGEDGCVVIPAGEIARHGHGERVELPATHAGSEFSAAGTTANGEALEISLAEKTGALARGPQIRLPFGSYRAEVAVELVADKTVEKPFRLALVAKTSHAIYADTSAKFSALTPGVTSETLSITFENAFPSAPILLDVILRDAVVAAQLRIRSVRFESA